ncbi:hypothetical protein ACIQZO_04755 [Streptomyces sp. NPDC097617]|uniref:hypothetical protein n=1 Tax=Streptomyces sp. NPDC097617 TaxID=3366091 RepID=UPI00381A976C
MSCGGARTQDFTSPQFLITPPQANVLSPSTDLVTMTIGGNDDLLFASVVAACVTAAATTLGQGHPCQNLYGSHFDNLIDNSIHPKLVGR